MKITNFRSLFLLCLICLIFSAPVFAASGPGFGNSPTSSYPDRPGEGILMPGGSGYSAPSKEGKNTNSDKKEAPQGEKNSESIKKDPPVTENSVSPAPAPVSQPVFKKEEPAPPKKANTSPKSEKIPSTTVVQYQEKSFPFEKYPITVINGDNYLCLEDPDFKSLMESMGLTYSWFSSSKKLFVYLPQGSVVWFVDSNRAALGETPIDLPLAALEYNGKIYLPMESLAKVLDIQITKGEKLISLKPGLTFTSGKSKEENTIDIFLSAAGRLEYEAKYQAEPPAVRLTIPRAAYNGASKEFCIEGVKTKINDTLHKDKIYVTLEFPSHWKGEIIRTSFKNQLLVRMRPNIVYAWGTKDAVLNSVKLKREGEQIGFDLSLSTPVQYFSTVDTDKKTLYIDIPFVTPAKSFNPASLSGGFVKDYSVFTYKPGGINLTRIKISLKERENLVFSVPKSEPTTEVAQNDSQNGEENDVSTVDGMGKVIVIDPGHGGSDPGACNSALGLREKDITLDISKRLADLLTKRGWRVILTRYTDTDVTYPGSPDRDELQARCNVANRNKASLFISIHCNAAGRPDRKGSSYHWYKMKDRRVAEAFLGNLGEKIGTVDKGLSQDQFYVLSHTKAPALLVEVAFISNGEDAKILANNIKRQIIAQQFAASVDRFLTISSMARRSDKSASSSDE